MASVINGIVGGAGATATFATAEADGPPGGDATGASVLPIWATAELEAAQTKPNQRTQKLAFLRAHPVFGDAGRLKNAFCGFIADSAYHSWLHTKESYWCHFVGSLRYGCAQA
jgi:hypothetical protein